MKTKKQIVANYVRYYGGTPEYWADKLQGYWNKTPKSPNYQKQQAKPKKLPKRLVAPDGSTCFDSLTWEDGVATATFIKGGQTYEYDCSRSEFKDWIADSQGGYFNENIR
jgi:hypothetical protein